MTRLFYGSTLLAGLCAMTLIVGCGGSSSPTVVTCDGGNCGDAKRDGVKLDGAKLDGVQLDTPAPKLDGPAANLDGPAANLDGPPPKLDGPAPTTDGPPPVIPDGPAPTTDGPPPVIPDGPAPTTDGPPPVIPDGPAPNLDVRPPDVTIPNQDVRPPDTIITPPTDAADAAADTTPVIHDAGPDGTVTIHDGGGDGGTDGTVVSTDAVADTTTDGPVVIVDADAAAEAGADVTPVVTGDAGDGGVADAPEIDAPPAIDGGANDGPICEGDVCHAYTFEGVQMDGGLPPGFTAGAATGTWTLVMDGSNEVLEGFGADATNAFADVGFATWTDQTIEVKVRFVSLAVAGGNNRTVRICGRSNADVSAAYCLYVSTDGGTNTGATSIARRGGTGAISASGSTGLNIALNAWHTYTFSISGSGTVLTYAYMDGNSTAVANASDSSPDRIAQGAVAIGVRGATADFDNLIVTNP